MFWKNKPWKILALRKIGEIKRALNLTFFFAATLTLKRRVWVTLTFPYFLNRKMTTPLNWEFGTYFFQLEWIIMDISPLWILEIHWLILHCGKWCSSRHQRCCSISVALTEELLLLLPRQREERSCKRRSVWRRQSEADAWDDAALLVGLQDCTEFS